MALTTFLPSLPAELRALERYLLRRDVGAPSTVPTPFALEQTVPATGVTLDTIAWEFPEALGEFGLRHDGFILYVECASTADPLDGQRLKLSAESRIFQMAWGVPVTRSYAIAPYRITYAGESVGNRVQHPSWVGATGGGFGLACTPLCVHDATTVVACSGATSTAANFIQPGWILWGVRADVTQAITGATSFHVGDGVVPTLWGANVGVSLGARNRQTDWQQKNAGSQSEFARPVVLTAQGGNFTGGEVTLTAYYTDDWM